MGSDLVWSVTAFILPVRSEEEIDFCWICRVDQVLCNHFFELDCHCVSLPTIAHLAAILLSHLEHVLRRHHGCTLLKMDLGSRIRADLA